ncbi:MULTISPECIES: HesB/YadR/YfhF family protein [Bacillaceae]|uniref:HesB/YadR/YfhF family protein n=1 Tax=Bacillaceae TaxID=186817 RepID=UPI001E333904|nr:MULTISPECIES: HesB/YadR/YfhF family protein [Bacillaceae]MCE4047879.1 HesB/YadR/YfhF family protein [Bacillus sp. Au-Bac7]MCM3033289.1 HesB/YadR/YfhF family protein [Niallia sp. MER 6]MDL0436319.1 HesB/YadR/YfhF family protein [Niallia sp. SS-2023]UPO89279.1 HesB/YadR/YfhF family protein [Niallia sp. Man26]
MKIVVSDKAAEWYKDEMLLNEGDYVRFFARYGGCSTVQQGFSLGISNEKPVNSAVSTEKDGIRYYIEEKDLWYFDNNDLYANFNEAAQEPEYHYTEKQA